MDAESQEHGINQVQGIGELPVKERLTGGLERKGAKKPEDTRLETGRPGTECGSKTRDRKVQKAGIKRSEMP